MRYFNETNEVVQNYAVALFEEVKNSDVEFEVIINDLDYLNNMIKNNVEFNSFLHYPLISNEEKVKEIEGMLSNNVEKIVIDFIVLLTENQRITFLNLIMHEFKIHWRKYKNIARVKVTFGFEPTEEILNNVKLSMKEKLKADSVELDYIVNLDLLGGIKVFYDGKLIDNTLIQKIQRYAKQIRV